MELTRVRDLKKENKVRYSGKGKMRERERERCSAVGVNTAGGVNPG